MDEKCRDSNIQIKNVTKDQFENPLIQNRTKIAEMVLLPFVLCGAVERNGHIYDY